MRREQTVTSTCPGPPGPPGPPGLGCVSYLLSGPDVALKLLPQSAQAVVHPASLLLVLQSSAQLLHGGQPVPTRPGHLQHQNLQLLLQDLHQGDGSKQDGDAGFETSAAVCACEILCCGDSQPALLVGITKESKALLTVLKLVTNVHDISKIKNMSFRHMEHKVKIKKKKEIK